MWRVRLLPLFCSSFYGANVITLTLLHPVQLSPVQNWTFDESTLVRIGRASDNQVILYSAVVSRHHAEIRQVNSTWELVSLGANGTYLDGKRVTQVPIADGMIIRLARSGPNLQIHLTPSSQRSVKGRAITAFPSWKETQEDEYTQVSQPVGTLTAPASAKPVEITTHSSVLDSQLLNSKTTMETQHGTDASEEADEHITEALAKRGYSEIQLLHQTPLETTYLTSQASQSVVLKTLHPDRLNHPQALGLFEQQAKILQQINHPGIPRSLEFFRIQGQPFLAREVISGRTLLEYVNQFGKVDLKQAIAWIVEICEILEYLHTQPVPILHQDLRPENIILRDRRTSSYELALVEFGLLKGLAPERRISGYLAPEQKMGQTTLLSDLYAIGTVLAFLISGQDPALFYKQWRQEYRFSPELIPGLQPELIEVLYHLTASNPSDRYTSAREVALALKAVI